MNILKSLENRVRGWFPKEPNIPSTKVKATKVPNPPKAVRVVILFGILAIMAVTVVIFFMPFVNQPGLYRAVPTIIGIVSTVVVAYLVNKKTLPKPTSRDRKIGFALVAIVLLMVLVNFLINRYLL